MENRMLLGHEKDDGAGACVDLAQDIESRIVRRHRV